MYEQHVIIDFEMNPVSKDNYGVGKFLRREIIEIGAVKLDENYHIVDQFSCLVKPEHNTDITGYITELTGINTVAVKKACDFKIAIQKLESWIGNKRTRIYSWSDTDLIQLKNECVHKMVGYPENMRRWVDLQMIYPKVMEIKKEKKMSLTEAAEWSGVYIDKKKAHRALYDAEITTELLLPILNGEYKKQIEVIQGLCWGVNHSGFTLGDICNGLVLQFV